MDLNIDLSDFEEELHEPTTSDRGLTPAQRQKPCASERSVENLTPETLPSQPCQGRDDTASQPTRRFTGDQADEFKKLRKLVYKKSLAKYYRDEILKGIQENKFQIQLQKPALNLVEGNRAPLEFEQLINDILHEATEKINNAVANLYEDLIPQLHQEWELHIEVCKTKFGLEATKTVVSRAKAVALEFLRNKLSNPSVKKEEERETPLRPKNEQTPRGSKRGRSTQRPSFNRRNQGGRNPVEKILQFLKTLQ